MRWASANAALDALAARLAHSSEPLGPVGGALLPLGLGFAEAAGDVLAHGDVHSVPGLTEGLGHRVEGEAVGGTVAGVREVPAAEVPGPAEAAALEDLRGAVTAGGAFGEGPFL